MFPVTDNSDLINMVVKYGDFLRLAYHTEMGNYTSVQWAFQHQTRSNLDIYYADKETGKLCIYAAEAKFRPWEARGTSLWGAPTPGFS